MTATVITYRTRSAVRDCAKALGISLDRIDALSKVVDGGAERNRLPTGAVWRGSIQIPKSESDSSI